MSFNQNSKFNQQIFHEPDNSLNDSTISYKSSIRNGSNITNQASKHLPPLNQTSRTTSTFLTTPRNSSACSTKSSVTSKVSTKPESIVQNIECIVARNKILEEENCVLRNLISEETNKTFDERRVLILKSQVYQLEKQINILSKQLAFRKHAHTEALNTFTYLAETFRSITIFDECKNKISSSVYNVEKQNITKWLELCESTRVKLTKSENDNYEDMAELSEPTLFHTNFSKHGPDTSLLDICSGNLNHVNIKQVAPLESNLANLFKKLIKLKESLKTMKNQNASLEDGNHDHKATSEYLPIHRESLYNLLDETTKSCSNCCTDLFNLSLLIPSAPWQSIKKSQIKVVKEEDLMQKLKSFSIPKSKQSNVEMLLKSYYIASNYHIHMKNLECLAMNEELNFYRSCYSLQKSYVESVLDSVKTKYKEFIEELHINLNEPLNYLIEKFWQMKKETTEVNFKLFFESFKKNSEKFTDILKKLQQFPDNNLIDVTFDQILVQLDNQIVQMSQSCKDKLKDFNLNINDTKQVSMQSDELLSDILKIPNLDTTNYSEFDSTLR